jgi:hypothetical protein
MPPNAPRKSRWVKIFFNDDRSTGYEEKCLEERALRGMYGSQNHTSHKGGPLMKQAYLIKHGVEARAGPRAVCLDRGSAPVGGGVGHGAWRGGKAGLAGGHGALEAVAASPLRFAYGEREARGGHAWCDGVMRSQVRPGCPRRLESLFGGSRSGDVATVPLRKGINPLINLRTTTARPAPTLPLRSAAIPPTPRASASSECDYWSGQMMWEFYNDLQSGNGPVFPQARPSGRGNHRPYRNHPAHQRASEPRPLP